ncbi:hypothetical protein AURDEDRAFT_114257, partial [Auricularia subglabra TFB-10046 SS5]
MLRRSQTLPLSVKLHGEANYSPGTIRAHDTLRPHLTRLRALECEELPGNLAEMPLLEVLGCTETVTLSRSSQNLRAL